MQNGLLPYKGALNSLLPILKKGNAEAFSQKMATLFDVKKYKPLAVFRICMIPTLSCWKLYI